MVRLVYWGGFVGEGDGDEGDELYRRWLISFGVYGCGRIVNGL